MGWLFGYSSPSEILREMNEHCAPLKVVRQASTCYGGHLWTLYEEPSGRRFINLNLIKKHGDQWGYKGIDESCGPNEVDCPLALIEGASDPSNNYAREWRDKVREYHANRTRTFEKRPRGQRLIVRDKNAPTRYRCSAAKMKPVLSLRTGEDS